MTEPPDKPGPTRRKTLHRSASLSGPSLANLSLTQAYQMAKDNSPHLPASSSQQPPAAYPTVRPLPQRVERLAQASHRQTPSQAPTLRQGPNPVSATGTVTPTPAAVNPAVVNPAVTPAHFVIPPPPPRDSPHPKSGRPSRRGVQRQSAIYPRRTEKNARIPPAG